MRIECPDCKQTFHPKGFTNHFRHNHREPFPRRGPWRDDGTAVLRLARGVHTAILSLPKKSRMGISTGVEDRSGTGQVLHYAKLLKCKPSGLYQGVIVPWTPYADTPDRLIDSVEHHILAAGGSWGALIKAGVLTRPAMLFWLRGEYLPSLSKLVGVCNAVGADPVAVWKRAER